MFTKSLAVLMVLVVLGGTAAFATRVDYEEVDGAKDVGAVFFEGTWIAGNKVFDAPGVAHAIAGLGMRQGTSGVLRDKSAAGDFFRPGAEHSGDIAARVAFGAPGDVAGGRLFDIEAAPHAALVTWTIDDASAFTGGLVPGFAADSGRNAPNRGDEASVPEPALVFFIGAGLLGLACLQRRWRKKYLRFRSRV